MSNFKLIKTAAALALGASVVTSAVVPTDASAASKYKIKNGKLVIAKTGKVAKGYVTYKSTVYKNGKKLTGLKGKTYYKAGKKATGTYKGAYYYKGAKKVTTGTYKGAYYVKGVKKVTTGLYNGRYYKSGAKATGTYKGAYYVKGTKKVTTGTYNGAYYVKGFKKVTTGLYKEEFYQDGKLSKGYALYKSILYKDAVHNVGLTVFEGKLYDGVSVNKGTEVFEGKLYNGAVLATGLVEHAGLFYNEGALANGVVNGVEYKDGVVVKYEVTEVKAINAKEVEIKFSTDVNHLTALKAENYQVEINKVGSVGSVLEGDSELNVAYKGSSKDTVILELKSAAFSTGDKVVVQVKDGIKTEAGKTIERFASEVINYSNSAAPKLLTEPKFSNGDLTLVFDRPVDTDKQPLVKVDGKAFTGSTLKKSTSYSPGNYVYVIEGMEVFDKKFVENGTHELIMYDIFEKAGKNPEKTSVISDKYLVTADNEAPRFESVEAINANKFIVKFSESVTLGDVTKNLKVSKGNHTFTYIDGTENKLATVEDEVNVSYEKANTAGTAYYVVVNEPKNDDAAKTALNPLYAGSETSVTLDITAENYVDSSKLLGVKTTKQVKLSKGTISPESKKATLVKDTSTARVLFAGDAIISNKLNDTVNLDSNKLVVQDENGIVIPTTDYEAKIVAPDSSELQQGYKTVVEVKITNPKYQKQSKYTIGFKDDAIKFKQVLNDVSEYNFEDTKNKKFTVVAGVSADNNFKYYALDLDGKVTSSTTKDNELFVNFGADMGDSALEISNYQIDGKDLPTGTEIKFFESKKQVRIVLPKAYVTNSTTFLFTVKKDVKTAAGQQVVNNLQKLENAETRISLVDNVAPTLKALSKQVVSKDAKLFNQLEVEFSENLLKADTGNFEVVINGSKVEVKKATLLTGENASKVRIELADSYAVNQNVKVTIVANATNDVLIEDKSNNKATIGSSVELSKDALGEVDTLLVAELLSEKQKALTTLETEYPKADFTAKQTAYEAQINSVKDVTELKDVAVKLAAAKTEIAKLDSDQKIVDAKAAAVTVADVKFDATATATPVIKAIADATFTTADLAGTGVATKVETTGDVTITRGSVDGTFTLVATFTVGSKTAVKEFTVTVPTAASTAVTVAVKA
ncbi:hypothetical protein KZO01_19790 [Kurthia zopfii]|uniref:Uncharacterized protein n=1 Tax=Kurthia zopfii TaxID=1650 RepID=A0A8B4Q8T0_9BACL|nr:hypothetical protein [Kurthia zopfii]PWI22530.1 hypothetical protein DF281_06845 [Kurthia zopfii]TDR38659.1 hypothetical protein DFR61_11534 [Kurthia zopfii]GEK31670.1 hypothetical protein KZO01_19790 [Kurthia zopfii]STX08734.1 Uncharacterised protein [Kurthia zopfii]